MKNIQIALLFVASIAAIYYLAPNNPASNSHSLITETEAEAYITFTKWMQTHAKRYREDGETSYRFRKFFQNFKFVKAHNARYAKGEETFDVELNQFADLDNVQFAYLYTGLKKKETKSKILGITTQCKSVTAINESLPATFDWAGKAVSSVKNQGSCGSCWAFSTVGGLEGLDAIKSGTVRSFSPQQLVDCAGGSYQNEGCNGGDMDLAYEYVIDHGITTEAKYPYKGRDQKCAYTSSMKEFGISDCAWVPANKTKALQSAVLVNPVSISVDAGSSAFQLYRSGVMTNAKCGLELNHGIVLTGYGSLNGQDYWNCKNSWGASWGLNGYILLGRDGKDGPGQCGILMENTLPIA